jgi:hypothetical protein
MDGRSTLHDTDEYIYSATAGIQASARVTLSEPQASKQCERVDSNLYEGAGAEGILYSYMLMLVIEAAYRRQRCEQAN